MCGIAGIFAYGQAAPPIEEEELLRIREAMVRRGPDGEGLWISADRRAGLAHRRLAIIDLSNSGAQPMVSADGRYRITFNGEIYNYRELRKELEGRGTEFRSQSDTEVLLHLYAMRGREMVRQLRGMFAFGIFDSADQSLFLARDPFGIKPLYYADDGSSLRFASQVKALLKGGGVDTRPAPAGQVGFYLWGHLPDPHTLYRGIKALPAGSTLRSDAAGRSEPKAYFSIAEEIDRAGGDSTGLSAADAQDRLNAALRASVRRHLVSDVPVGVFLSSGLDSTTLTALAAETGSGELRTVTLGFDEYRGSNNDETVLASLVARRYGALHRTHWVSRSNFAVHMDEMLEAMDQPSIDGVNTYFVSRAAAQDGMKVALSGIGGDELFGGYPSFRELPVMTRAFGWASRFPGLGRGFRRVSTPLLKRLTSPKYAGLLEYGGSLEGAYLLRRGLFMPWELPEFLDSDLVRQGWDELQTLLSLGQTIGGMKEDFQKISALEMAWYMRNQLLRDADWAGMAHSLEIRVPLVDVDLFREVVRRPIDGQATKQHMARAPLKALPREIVERRKTGFSVPVRSWLGQPGTGGPFQRGVRAWACRIHPPAQRPKRVLALVTDAFGGHGGIAKFNRDFLGAVCSHPGIGKVVALPRLLVSPAGPLPPKLDYRMEAAGGKFNYLRALMVTLVAGRAVDLVICGHVRLVPLALLARAVSGGRLVLVIHGIDAWRPTRNLLTNFLVGKVDSFVSVSALSMERFIGWTGLGHERGFVLPNSIDLAAFAPGAKDPALTAKYGFQDRVVVMTMGRLASAERYKGIDEMLEILPSLIAEIPNLAYMIAGDGDDRMRLHQKAVRLGLQDRVVFTGLVPEARKCDYYNLADVFIMPSRGEGFGIVFLEAMACGVPVVGSAVDGSREALRGGMLGALVDPGDSGGIKRAILAALRRPKGVPDGLDYFSYANFERRVHQMLDRW